MAECNISPAEAQKIETVSLELDAAIEEFFADARTCLDEEQWSVLFEFGRACVRRAICVGASLHAVVDAHPERAYPGRGRSAFVRGALAAWRDSFAPIEDPWRLAPILELVPGGERRVLADVEALEVMAANRMFASLDEQCAGFLSAS